MLSLTGHSRRGGGGGGRGNPLCRLYRYVRHQRVWFLTPFGLKLGIDLTIWV